MNRFDKVALCAVIGITLFGMTRAVTVSDLYLEHASSSQWAIWFAGQVLLTYGPIAVAALCWRLSKHGRFGWVAHILILPAAILLLNLGESLMLSVTDFPDFDDTIGEPVMPGFFLFLIALAIYCGALVSRLIGAIRLMNP